MLTITLPQLRKEIKLTRRLAKMAKENGEKFASPRALQGLKKASWEKVNSKG